MAKSKIDVIDSWLEDDRLVTKVTFNYPDGESKTINLVWIGNPSEYDMKEELRANYIQHYARHKNKPKDANVAKIKGLKIDDVDEQ